MQPTRWNYSKEEWRNFLHWKTRRKGWLFLFFRKLVPVKSQHVPEIRITADTVWVNNAQQSFRDENRRYKAIQIRQAGAINIMEIFYEQSNRVRNIDVPIPRGKLREAFEVQDRLTEHGELHIEHGT
jgi:hypothetical protein